MFDALLRANRRWGAPASVWPHVKDFTSLLHEATPRAIALVLPHVPWRWFAADESSIQLWVAGVSAVQYTEDVAESVVETLLRIVPEEELLQHITVDVWSWLKKWPHLHYRSLHSRRSYESRRHVVKAIRRLNDIETLKRYFLLVWSDGNTLPDDGFDETCASLREDFGRVGMGHHRFDLIEKLDQILGELELPTPGRKPDPKQSRSAYYRRLIRKMKVQYRGLKDVLLETNIEAISRTSYL